MMINLLAKVLAFIVLSLGLYFTVKLKEKTIEVTPVWLLIYVGVLFLQIYALSDVIEFGGYMVLGDTPLVNALAEIMDWTEFSLTSAAASFLTAAGLLLKKSIVKPI
jgi:hypothetical protein